MTFSVRKEEGLEDIPFRCGRGVGEEGVEKMEDGFECQLSDHTVCDPCIYVLSRVAFHCLQLQLQLYLHVHAHICCLHAHLLYFHHRSIPRQILFLILLLPIGVQVHAVNGEEASSVTPGSFVFSFEGDPLQDSDGREAYCGI